jgi:hypothetical protein
LHTGFQLAGSHPPRLEGGLDEAEAERLVDGVVDPGQDHDVIAVECVRGLDQSTESALPIPRTVFSWALWNPVICSTGRAAATAPSRAGDNVAAFVT